MDLSIVIPAFNEGHKIQHDVNAASEFLAQNNLTGEIIIVDDGSADNTAKSAESCPVHDSVSLLVKRYEQNRGKGYAIRTGMAASSGNVVMFADSGVCIPFKTALQGLDLINADQCELAHGSRRLPDSVIVRAHLRKRQLTARIFRLLVRFFMGIPRQLTDTQCGFKMYKGDIGRQLYAECQIDGFMFDIEVILRALKSGYCIKEFPVEWTADLDTRLALSKMPVQLVNELLAIKKYLRN